jgi:hypothetical protein
MILVLFSAPFKHVSQRQPAFTIRLLAQRMSASHEKRQLGVYVEGPKLELILPMMLQIWKVVFYGNLGLL